MPTKLSLDRDLSRLEILHLRGILSAQDVVALSVYALDSPHPYLDHDGASYGLTRREQQDIQYELAGYTACNLVRCQDKQYGRLFTRDIRFAKE